MGLKCIVTRVAIAVLTVAVLGGVAYRTLGLYASYQLSQAFSCQGWDGTVREAVHNDPRYVGVYVGCDDGVIYVSIPPGVAPTEGREVWLADLQAIIDGVSSPKPVDISPPDDVTPIADDQPSTETPPADQMPE